MALCMKTILVLPQLCDVGCLLMFFILYIFLNSRIRAVE